MKGLQSILVAFLFIIVVFSCSCSGEKSLIKSAREENTERAYQSYLMKYSNGKYAKEAKQKISDFKFNRLRDSVFSDFMRLLEREMPSDSDAISILPENPVLMGTDISISINGLDPEGIIRLHAFRRFWDGILYSFAEYETGSDGRIALNKSNARSGTFEGVDSLGLFWSMTWPSPNKKDLPFDVDSLDMNEIHLVLESDGSYIDRASVQLVDTIQGIVSEQISNDALVAGFHYPNNLKNLPAMILLSGSEGGHANTDKMAKVFASHGIAVLSLAYFNDELLPDHLERIPLEYFYNALDWLKSKSTIDTNRIFIAGGSRGGELALLIASKRPEIKGVVAVEPSCVLWQGLPHNPGSMFFPKPAWTEHGEALPFVKHRLHLPTLAQFGTGARQIELLSLYEGKLDNVSDIEPAFIKAENINGPILLVAGKDDRLWPSYTMCKILESRLRDKQFRYPVHSLYYDNAGHYVTITPDYSPTITYKYEQTKVGGTDSGNAAAQIDSWNKIIDFLNKYLIQAGN